MAKLPGVKWDGLESFKREIQIVQAGLLDEAEEILQDAAWRAAAQIIGAYPSGGSGNLRKGVKVVPVVGLVLVGAEVKNIASHALWYEEGTDVRETRGKQNRGRMPPQPTFYPIADAWRRRALREITARLYQKGATRVTGDPDGN